MVQQGWARAYQYSPHGERNPYQPEQLYYLSKGVVEIWESRQAVQWYKNKLLKINRGSSAFYLRSMRTYRLILKKLAKYWSQSYLKTPAKLAAFHSLMVMGTKYFVVYYYSADDPRTPKSIRQHALKIRKADRYFDDSHRLIVNTIKHLYPRIGNYANGLLSHEIFRPPSVAVMRKRFLHSIFVADQPLFIGSLKSYAGTHDAYRFIQTTKKSSKEVSGSTGYSGVARGKVRIILLKKDIRKLKKGEVLVTSMTTPDFIPAMKRSAAFVTDEGGITSHAAVVAREMKKPCVIGTHFATKVFKTGDRVEVDATRGIVKKI